MTTIKLQTEINASIQTVFDLNRNIDIHKLSTSKSKETVIAGVTSGLIHKGETVTWRGKHFGIYLTHKSLISQMEFPHSFIDEMVEGKFKSFKHQHVFYEKEGKTIMEDQIEYETPFGIFGSVFDTLILKNHLTTFIKERNEFIKKTAEHF
ncbi:SRPBCC family protein [Flavobacterium tegetincola]|uniref:SRPBCC family protein n=1 Tax=Flavobacterium tegetincola TaxID=150172 RepID=UPI0004230C1A|nr:SRPBCC family protein [Flavobacterium tegetincola]